MMEFEYSNQNELNKFVIRSMNTFSVVSNQQDSIHTTNAEISENFAMINQYKPVIVKHATLTP